MKRNIVFNVEIHFDISEESNEHLTKLNKKIQDKIFDTLELARQDNAFCGDGIEANWLSVETGRIS